MDHPEISAQVFPSSSKSISFAHIMPELQPFQPAMAVVLDTFSGHTTQCPISPFFLELGDVSHYPEQVFS